MFRCENRIRGKQVQILYGPATVSMEQILVTMSPTGQLGREDEAMMCKPVDLHKALKLYHGELIKEKKYKYTFKIRAYKLVNKKKVYGRWKTIKIKK